MTKSFEETIEVLREAGVVFDDQSPRLPDSLPQFDDEDPCGFSVFRTDLEDQDLSNLDMRRTFFSKSGVSDCNFRGTNLEESNLCWNDFINLDLTGANLSKSDLRASLYDGVIFTDCNLEGSDLRQSDFVECKFDGANMKGVKLTKATAALISLSDTQKKDIDWQTTEGAEPAGG
ncbi:hypothetical protein Misp06_00002 [Microbulbifer sp. NBRC 101763]|uniref:pentapeptide repeat-containing protein n=1 Tax=Microbulbifer sp. NBRC 101763 TaxID=1113820 RepID=UPI0030ABCBA5